MYDNIIHNFAEDLVKCLETKQETFIEYINVECCSKTCKNKKCRNKVKTNIAYDWTQNTLPMVLCNRHHNYITEKQEWNLIIEELDNNKYHIVKIYNEECVYLHINEIEKHTFNKPDDITKYRNLYASREYNNAGRLVQETILNDKVSVSNFTRPVLHIDAKVWILPNLCINICYIKEIGKINMKEVDGKKDKLLLEETIKSFVENNFQLNQDYQECNICLNSCKLYNLGCNDKHNYCSSCISKFYSSKNTSYDIITCPLCRKPVKEIQSIRNTFRLCEQQSKSPQYIINSYILDHIYPYKNILVKYFIEIKSNHFTFKSLMFSKTQKNIYNLIKFLLEKRLFFQNINDKIYYTISTLNQLQDKINNNDIHLIDDLTNYIRSVGITERI